MKLNDSIEVVAVEAIAGSRFLLAIKGTDLNAETASCLPVLIDNGVAIPNDELNLVARETTFNAFDFIEPEERINYLQLFKRYFNDENIENINFLFQSKAPVNV